MWAGSVPTEQVGNLAAETNEDDKELWGSPQYFYNPKKIDARLLREARDKEHEKLVEFETFKWARVDECAGGKWITSRGRTRSSPTAPSALFGS